MEEAGNQLLGDNAAEAGMTAMATSLIANALHEDLAAMEQRIIASIEAKGCRAKQETPFGGPYYRG